MIMFDPKKVQPYDKQDLQGQEAMEQAISNPWLRVICAFPLFVFVFFSYALVKNAVAKWGAPNEGMDAIDYWGVLIFLYVTLELAAITILGRSIFPLYHVINSWAKPSVRPETRDDDRIGDSDGTVEGERRHN